MKTFTKLKVLSVLFLFVALIGCKENDEEPEVKLTGKWNFDTRNYVDSTSPEFEDNTGKGYYLELKEDMTYTVLYAGESGSGRYTVSDEEISFTVLSGDDDITDGDTYRIMSLTAKALVLEAGIASTSGEEYTHELKFSR